MLRGVLCPEASLIPKSETLTCTCMQVQVSVAKSTLPQGDMAMIFLIHIDVHAQSDRRYARIYLTPKILLLFSPKVRRLPVW